MATSEEKYWFASGTKEHVAETLDIEVNEVNEAMALPEYCESNQSITWERRASDQFSHHLGGRMDLSSLTTDLMDGLPDEILSERAVHCECAKKMNQPDFSPRVDHGAEHTWKSQPDTHGRMGEIIERTLDRAAVTLHQDVSQRVLTILQGEAGRKPQLTETLRELFESSQWKVGRWLGRMHSANALIQLGNEFEGSLCDMNRIEWLKDQTVEFIVFVLVRRLSSDSDEFDFLRLSEHPSEAN